LVIPRQAAVEVALLKSVALRYVMSDPERLAMQEQQRQLLTELLKALGEYAPRALEPAFQSAWRAAVDDGERYRVLVDQVASLTDAQAVAWHRAYVAAG